MKFVADESVDRGICLKLRDLGYAVEAIEEILPSIDDDEVLDYTVRSGSILVTADKDFGELVYRLGRIHDGIILLRLDGLKTEARAEIVAAAIQLHESQLLKNFVVITHDNVRIRMA